MRSTIFLSNLDQVDRDRLIKTMYLSILGISGSSVLREPKVGSSCLKDQHEIHHFYASGFMVYMEQARCFVVVTAGHVLEEIKKNESSQRRIHDLHIHDRGPIVDEVPGVPLRRELLIIFTEYKERPDVDCGCFTIPPFEANAILAGREVAAVNSSLCAETDEEFDAYFLLGFPVTARTAVPLVNDASTYRVAMEFGCPMLGITPCEVEDSRIDVRDRFSAKIDIPDDPKIKNIEGMSGGPVWGVRQVDNYLECRLVGIQSEWIPSKKVVLVERAKPFFASFEKEFVKLRDSATDGRAAL